MIIKIKNIALFVIVFILIGGIDAYAASAGISASSTNVYVGDNVTINVSINAGSWNLQVNGSGISDSIVGYDMDGNKSSTKSYSLNTSNPGSYTVSLSGDITDYDTDINSGVNSSVTIVVNSKPEPVPEPVAPQPEVVPNGSTNNSTNTNTNKSNNTTNNNNNKQTKEEIKKEEPVQEEIKEVVEEKIEITKFEIVGYELGFDVNKLNYDINILDGISDLYIVVEGKELDVTGAGKVSILGKESIEVTVKHKELEKKYTIKFNRLRNNDIISSSKNESKSDNKNNPIFIVTTVIFLISTIVLSVLYILEKKKHINK